MRLAAASFCTTPPKPLKDHCTILLCARLVGRNWTNALHRPKRGSRKYRLNDEIGASGCHPCRQEEKRNRIIGPICPFLPPRDFVKCPSIRKMVWAVGIENNNERNLRDLEEMLGSAKLLERNNRECNGILIGIDPEWRPLVFLALKFPCCFFARRRVASATGQISRHGWQADDQTVRYASGMSRI